MTTLSSTERGEHTPGLVERLRAAALVEAVGATLHAGTETHEQAVAALERDDLLSEAADLISELVEVAEDCRIFADLVRLRAIRQGDTEQAAEAADAFARADAIIAKARGGAE